MYNLQVALVQSNRLLLDCNLILKNRFKVGQVSIPPGYSFTLTVGCDEDNWIISISLQ